MAIMALSPAISPFNPLLAFFFPFPHHWLLSPCSCAILFLFLFLLLFASTSPLFLKPFPLLYVGSWCLLFVVFACPCALSSFLFPFCCCCSFKLLPPSQPRPSFLPWQFPGAKHAFQSSFYLSFPLLCPCAPLSSPCTLLPSCPFSCPTSFLVHS